MTRSALLRALETAGVRHAFVEDCPCGACEDFFAFGRGRGGSLWIAFSIDGDPMHVGREGGATVPLAKVSKELRRVLTTMREVLEVSDPPEGLEPLSLSPPLPARAPIPPPLSPALAARVLGRIGGIAGGQARAVKLSAEERSAIARRGALLRWQRSRAAGLVPHGAKLITFRGETLLMRQWAERLGLSHEALRLRLKRMSVAEALTTPAQKQRRRSA